MKEPDMQKVRRAVAAIEAKRRAASPKKGFRELPLKPSPIAADAAIRKPLKSHGNPCRSGFNCSAFLNRD